MKMASGVEWHPAPGARRAARGAEIDFRIHRRGRGPFQKYKPDAEGFVRSEALGRAFRLTRDRNPRGGWRYDLRSR